VKNILQEKENVCLWNFSRAKENGQAQSLPTGITDTWVRLKSA
jgi:hypothetical protein